MNDAGYNFYCNFIDLNFDELSCHIQQFRFGILFYRDVSFHMIN